MKFHSPPGWGDMKKMKIDLVLFFTELKTKDLLFSKIQRYSNLWILFMHHKKQSVLEKKRESVSTISLRAAKHPPDGALKFSGSPQKFQYFELYTLLSAQREGAVTILQVLASQSACILISILRRNSKISAFEEKEFKFRKIEYCNQVHITHKCLAK